MKLPRRCDPLLIVAVAAALLSSGCSYAEVAAQAVEKRTQTAMESTRSALDYMGARSDRRSFDQMLEPHRIAAKELIAQVRGEPPRSQDLTEKLSRWEIDLEAAVERWIEQRPVLKEKIAERSRHYEVILWSGALADRRRFDAGARAAGLNLFSRTAVHCAVVSMRARQIGAACALLVWYAGPLMFSRQENRYLLEQMMQDDVLKILGDTVLDLDRDLSRLMTPQQRERFDEVVAKRS